MENEIIHLTGYLDDVQCLNCTLSYPEDIEGKLSSVSGELIDISSAAISVQSKTITPLISSQVIIPDSGYNYLSRVTVNAIPYIEIPNEANGITVRIG